MAKKKTKEYGGRWKTLKTLTEGGQAQIFLVEDRTGEYDEPSVLKRVLNPARDGRFRDEVEAIKTLLHPNIVRLLDHSALDAPPAEEEKQYLVMPQAKGGDLSKIVGRYRGALDDVLKVARQTALALQAAHAAHIIHRDVKPENILFPGEGHDIWLSDFGICLIQTREKRNTEDGEVVGPAMFMAPELEGGGELGVSPDVDIYSLGKVIYYMITGGTRLPRERLHEEAYAQPFSAGGRLLKLKILLSQMICAHPERIKSMDEVIRRLNALDAGGAEPASEAGSAAVDQLKQSVLSDREHAQQKRDEEERRQTRFDDVHKSVLEVIQTELAAAAARLTEPNLTKSAVQPFNPGRMVVMGLASKSQALDGYEITFQREGPHERITALQFAFYRKGTVRPASQPVKEPVGVWPVLQIREAADNRLVKGCHAYVDRKAQGRGRFAYGVGNEPVRYEFDVSEWPEKAEELRAFLRNCIDAFPELIGRGPEQFVWLELQNKQRRR